MILCLLLIVAVAFAVFKYFCRLVLYCEMQCVLFFIGRAPTKLATAAMSPLTTAYSGLSTAVENLEMLPVPFMGNGTRRGGRGRGGRGHH